jgi:DNA-binding LacI/PurR family transcriptional regulator
MVTIKDIARAAQVSHTTVSRALRDYPNLTETTIAKIKRIAVDMGYVPNASARNLKNRRTRALGVIVSALSDPFWGEVLEGIDSVLHSTGYSLLVAATHREELREKEVVQTMVQHGVEGVIICAPQFAKIQSEALGSYGLPMVIVNNDGATDAESLIYNDDTHGVSILTRHLIDLGHQQIAFLGNEIGGRTNRERKEGFLEVMKQAGLTVPPEFLPMAPEGTPNGGYHGTKKLWAHPVRPTALLCYNDYMVPGVYRALAEKGVRVPQDLSVAGFDDIALSFYFDPPLTTYRQDKQRLGIEAANMILKAVEPGVDSKKKTCSHVVKLRGELVIRSSTAERSKALG